MNERDALPTGDRGAAPPSDSGHARADRWEVRIGSAVECPDGRAGTVKQVVISPRTRAVTQLVMERGFLLRQDVAVPVDAIASADEGVVRLRLSAEALNSLPRYRPEEHVTPHVTWEAPGGYASRDVRFALPGPLATLRRLAPAREGRAVPAPGTPWESGPAVVGGARVTCRDGAVGRVALVLLDPGSRRATHVVVRQSGMAGRHVIVPLDWATEIGPARLVLDVEREQFARLPEYRPDNVLHSEVEAALWAEAPLRWLALPTIRVTVQDGVVTLRGHVPTGAQRARAVAVARQVPGVLAVHDELVADDDLAIAVARALGRDPRTRGQRLQVDAFQGIVHLRGDVPTGAVLAAAEEVAAGVPGVRAVANLLVAPDATPAPPRVILPPTGVLVYATDGEVGRVTAVVVSPRSRQVTDLIVDAQFVPEDPATPLVARRVIVPAEVVARGGAGGVVLDLPAARVMELPTYREEDFTIPDPAWQPPFGYERTDVRFALDAAGSRRPELAAAPSGAVATTPNFPGTGRGLRPIQRGQRVVGRAGELGTVDHVLLDPATQRVTHFVVRAGGALPKDTIIPIDWVTALAEGEIVVEAGAAQLAALPAYVPERPDATIAADVRERLRKVPAVAEGQASVDVAVTAGAVNLSGRVPDEATRGEAVRAVGSAPGVWEVRATELDIVDEAALESFPASDPPAWTLRGPELPTR